MKELMPLSNHSMFRLDWNNVMEQLREEDVIS